MPTIFCSMNKITVGETSVIFLWFLEDNQHTGFRQDVSYVP